MERESYGPIRGLDEWSKSCRTNYCRRLPSCTAQSKGYMTSTFTVVLGGGVIRAYSQTKGLIAVMALCLATVP